MDCRPIPVSKLKSLATLPAGFAASALGRFDSACPLRSEVEKVVILEPFGMGDVISLEPALRAFRQAGCRTTIVVRKPWWGLYEEDEADDWIDARVPWSSYDSVRKYSPADYLSAGFRRFFSQLRAACNGAIGIDPRGDIRSVLLLKAAGCRQVMTLSHYLGTDLKMPRASAFPIAADQNLRRWEQNAAFPCALGIHPDGMPVLRRFGKWQVVKGRRLGLIPTVTWAGKEWPAASWRALVARCQAGGCIPVGLCGPGQLDDARKQLGDELDILECPNLESWATRFLMVGGVVACDTGPMHLANIMGVPTVAMYGSGKLPLWAPSGANARILEHQSDSSYTPCQPTHGSILFAQSMMAKISVDEVLNALNSLDFETTAK